MRIILLFLLIMIALGIGIIPYADGYLVKQTVLNNVEQLQALQASQHSEYEIKVVDYQAGWIKSTARITISNTNDKSVALPIDLAIQHGPIVFINSTPTVALAFIHSSVSLPATLLQHPPTKTITLNMTSLVPLDQNITTINYSVAPITAGNELKWDGLTGESTIIKNRNVITSVKTKIIIGKLSVTETNTMMGQPLTVTLDPVANETTYSRESDKNTSSSYSFKSGSVNVGMTGMNYFTMQSSTGTVTSNVNAGMFGSKFDAEIANIQINPMIVSPTLATIPSLKYSYSIDNLSQENILKTAALVEHERQHLMGNYQKLEEAVFSIFTNKSTFTTNLALETPAGKSSGQLQLAFTGAPKGIVDLKTMLDGKLEARVNKALFNELMSLYLSIMAPPKVIAPSSEPQMQLRTDSNGYFQGVADLVKNNSITPEQSVALMKLPDGKPDSATLAAIVDKMVLAPEVKASIITLYANQYMPVEKPAPAAPVPSIVDPQTQIATLIQDGALKDEGDAYSFTLEKTGQEIKVNGSADSVAATNFKALLNGEKPPQISIGNSEEPTPGEIALASVAANEQTNYMMQMIQGIAAAADALGQTNSKVTPDNIRALMPNHQLETPWGSAITFTAIDATSYKVELAATPENVCKQLAMRLTSNSKYTSITPTSDCKASGTTFSYVYDAAK